MEWSPYEQNEEYEDNPYRDNVEKSEWRIYE
jgi:hypothetical protein